jgi:hypothetical protein
MVSHMMARVEGICAHLPLDARDGVDLVGVRSGSGKSLGWPRVETILCGCLDIQSARSRRGKHFVPALPPPLAAFGWRLKHSVNLTETRQPQRPHTSINLHRNFLGKPELAYGKKRVSLPRKQVNCISSPSFSLAYPCVLISRYSGFRIVWCWAWHRFISSQNTSPEGPQNLQFPLAISISYFGRFLAVSRFCSFPTKTYV